MCDRYQYNQTAFPMTLETFREFLKTNPGPFEPSHARNCPLAGAFHAAGHTYVTVGTQTAYWQPAGTELPCHSAQAVLPEWALKFRQEYDLRGRYETGGLKYEGVPALQLLDELFPPPPVAEQPA